MLTHNHIADILLLIDRHTDRVELIKHGNDVFRLVSNTESFFLKTYTKDWYGSDPASTGFQAIHENMAWTILAKHGLSVPEIVYISSDSNNPIARPFILTRELKGRPLTELMSEANREEQSALLIAIGDTIRKMHEINFAFAGYLSTLSGPMEPPDANGWQHRCWSATVRETNATNQLQADEPHLTQGTYREVKQLCAQISTYLATAYQPPRFTHGDCHAHQFFLVRQQSTWHVTGILDMEVASAGDCGEDLLKICIELAQTLDYDTFWWKSLFAGYGSIPDLEAFRLRLLGVAPIEYGNLGKWIRSGDREVVLQHFLRARDWSMLFAPIESLATQ
ncbi:MAG: aminoglycoside phosphotransferase family protein [Anaerolineae bacterium]|nr:aminoglycoside phosphotransferase family protein [Anaerolineae bacterium]